MNNAVKPEFVPCEPDFAVNVDSPLTKLMCSLSAEDVQTNKKMLVESLNILAQRVKLLRFRGSLARGFSRGYHRVQIFLILIQEADCFCNGKQRNIRYVVSLKIRTYRRAENVWGFVFLGE